MDRTAEPTAATLINTLGEWELVNVIRRYGEEHWARRIARAILRARRRAPLQTTQDLAVIITQVIPPSARPPRIHPATRTFQALRIAVNQELSRLEESLEVAIACLARGDGYALLPTTLLRIASSRGPSRLTPRRRKRHTTGAPADEEAYHLYPR